MAAQHESHSLHSMGSMDSRASERVSDRAHGQRPHRRDDPG